MFCSSCGAESGQGATFCEKCGTPFPAQSTEPASPAMLVQPAPPVPPAPTPARVFCSRCGTESTDGLQFCTKCGTQLVRPAAAPPVQAFAAPYAVGASAPVPKVSWYAGLLGPNGLKGALIGAAAGLVFILLAAAVARPMIIDAWKPLLSVGGGSGVYRSLADGAITVPFLAVNLHVPAESVGVIANINDSPVTASLELQTPVSVWNVLALLAIALAAFVSVRVAQPSSARAALLQGAVTSVPYAVGMLAIAAVASSRVDLTSILAAAGAPSGSSAFITTSYPFISILLYCLVVGAALGAVVGLGYLAFRSRRPFGELVRATTWSATAPVIASLVALGIALIVSLIVTAGIWTYAKSKIPTDPYQSGTAQVVAVADGAVLELSPSFAFYVYDFGHGTPYTWTALGAASSGTVPGTARMSITGVSADYATGMPYPIPFGVNYEAWAYLLLLLPVVPLLVGGYLAASWSRGAGSLVVEGAKMAVPYAIGMVGLAWLTMVTLKLDIPVSASTGGSIAWGSDLLLTAVLALVWGAVFGALGGWIKQVRSSR